MASLLHEGAKKKNFIHRTRRVCAGHKTCNKVIYKQMEYIEGAKEKMFGRRGVWSSCKEQPRLMPSSNQTQIVEEHGLTLA